MTDTLGSTHSVRPIPEGYHTLTAALVVDNAAAAIDFYGRAFGAHLIGSMPGPDGKQIMHAELQIGDSRLMLSDEFPEMGDSRAPRTLGGSSASLHLYVEDADAAFRRAVEAGATVTMPLENAFWGDRYGIVTDPYGHRWGIATHLEDLSEEETSRRAQALYAESK